MTELRAARHALRETTSNVAKLRTLISGDDAKIAGLERAGRVHDAMRCV